MTLNQKFNYYYYLLIIIIKNDFKSKIYSKILRTPHVVVYKITRALYPKKVGF